MDTSVLRQQLIWTEQRIGECEHRIARLHELVSYMHQTGQEPKEASEMLRMEERQVAALEMDRKRLKATLEYYLGRGHD